MAETKYLGNDKYAYIENGETLEYWKEDHGISENENALFVKYKGRKFRILKTCDISGNTYALTIIIDCSKVDWFAGMPNAIAGTIWEYFYGNEWDYHEVLLEIKSYLRKEELKDI